MPYSRYDVLRTQLSLLFSLNKVNHVCTKDFCFGQILATIFSQSTLIYDSMDHPDGLCQRLDEPGQVLAKARLPFLHCRNLIHDDVVHI